MQMCEQAGGFATIKFIRGAGRSKRISEFASDLFGSVFFEKLPGFLEVECVSVDDELVFAGVIGDAEDALDTMAVLAQGLHDEIDVYHA
jgi:hypothetical protein